MTDDGQAMDKPRQRPEATLLRRARKAAGLSISEAADKAGVSPSWWSQVENSYVKSKEDGYRPVKAEEGTLAHMAAAVTGLTPERVATEGERPDAAEVMREIIEWRAPVVAEPSTATPPIAKPADADGFRRPSYISSGESYSAWAMEMQARELESKYRLLRHRDVDKIVTDTEKDTQVRAAALERERELEAEVRHLRSVTNGA